MTSIMLACTPPPMLSTGYGRSAVSARTVASTASSTWVKSRICEPSPFRVNRGPPVAASHNRRIAMSGRCRGPYTVKYRIATVGRPIPA